MRPAISIRVFHSRPVPHMGKGNRRTVPSVWHNKSFPTLQSLGKEYDFHTRPRHETNRKRRLSARPLCRMHDGIRTISHTHAHIIDCLPVRESLDDGTLTDILLGIVVVLQEVANHKLVLALGTKELAEANVVDEDPRQGMNEMQDERGPGRERGDERHGCRICDNQDEHGIGGPEKNGEVKTCFKEEKTGPRTSKHRGCAR